MCNGLRMGREYSRSLQALIRRLQHTEHLLHLGMIPSMLRLGKFHLDCFLISFILYR